MLYLLFGCGILLIPLSLYALFKIEKAKDNPNYKTAKIAAWITLLLGAAFVIIPRSVWKVEKTKAESEQKKLAAQQADKILTFGEFISAYSQNAPLYNADANLSWVFERGEQVDLGGAKINDISSINASIEKMQNQELRGVTVFVGNTSDASKMWEALFAAYAVVKAFEPNRPAESIPDFVSGLFDSEDGSSVTSGNVTYTITRTSFNTILSILYNE